jgi:hypothetical protein
MTNRRFALALVASIAIGIFHAWAFYHLLGLGLETRSSAFVPIGAFGVIVGWPLVVVYALAPGATKPRLRFRGIMRSLVSILGGMAGLSAAAGSPVWVRVSMFGLFVVTALSFWPVKSRPNEAAR